MKCTSLHITLVCLFAAQMLDGQQLIIKRQDAMQSYSAGTHVADAMNSGAVVSSAVAAENETVRYIIEVASASTAQQTLNKSALTTTAATASLRHNVKFKIDAVSSDIQTLREFSTVVNGYCIATKRKNLPAIQAISGVSRVYEDIHVSTYPISAASAATATVSPLLGVASGKGVKIGIIDTGIDYLHEALGGGFGANCKVCGGYDFVNNDSDPMDDNGHGTHVAGIIAGDSKTISGMASGASLYSYKVLDAAGVGYSSTVIAAIERAMQDSMKVINLSLGSTGGDPDDILSQAVDRAVASGIVVVVAAGNGGDFGMIGSPGAARGALTVGAVDSKNIPASFSSKGPVQKNFGIKPDIVAPGVGILSAKIGGGYVAMSGTSMSAPYVTAIAAVLCGLNPSWNATQVRDAVIESAQPLPYSYFVVGSGAADPVNAVQLRTIAAPGMMSLGFNTNTASTWTNRETVYVANVYSTPQTYTLAGSGSSPGISIQFSPATVEIAPHQQVMIIADVQADNTQLADNLSTNDGYTGSITASSAVDTIRIPFAFFKGTMLRMQFDEVPWQVIVHNRKDKSYTFQPKTCTLSAVVPAGTYDVLSVFFPSQYVIHEGVQASGIVDVSMNRTEAKHPVSITPTDESGAMIGTDLPHEVFSSIEGILHRGSGIGLISMSGGPFTSAQSNTPKYISDVSAAYVFGYTLNIQKENITTYTFETALDSGITDGVTIRFKPDEIKRLEVKYDIDTTKMSTVFPIVWSSIQQKSAMTGTAYYDGTADPLRYPFTQTSFYYKRTSPAFPVFHSREAYKY